MGIKARWSGGITAGCRQQSKGLKTEPRALYLEDDLENRGARKGDRRSSGKGQRRANIGNVLEAKRSNVHLAFLGVILGAGAVTTDLCVPSSQDCSWLIVQDGIFFLCVCQMNSSWRISDVYFLSTIRKVYSVHS